MLVIYCCVINCPEFSSLNQQMFIFSHSSSGAGMWEQLNWAILAQDLLFIYKLQLSSWLGPQSSQGLTKAGEFTFKLARSC